MSIKSRLSESQFQTRLAWTMTDLGAESLMNEPQIQEIANAIWVQREGVVKLLNQRLHICFGPSSADSSEVFVRGVVLQSTRTACFTQALETSIPGFSRFEVACRVAPDAPVVSISFGADKCPSLVRAILQYCVAMYKHHNILVQYVGCLARAGATTGHDVVKASGVQNTCFSMIKLPKQTDYVLRWISSIRMTCARNFTQGVVPINRALVQNKISHSSVFVEKVLELTLYRQFRLLAKAHPSSPTPYKPSIYEQDAYRDGTALAQQLHVDPADFESVKHCCDGTQIHCKCSHTMPDTHTHTHTHQSHRVILFGHESHPPSQPV